MPGATPRWLIWADRQLDRVAGALAVFGAVAVVALMAITLVAVISRYGFNDPIFGIEDLSVLVLTLVAAAAVAYGARHGAHVSVDVISIFFGRGVTRITDALMRGLVVATLGLAAYALITKSCGFVQACVTGNLTIAHRPFYYVLAFAVALYALQVLVHLLIALAHFQGDDPNELRD